MKPKTIMFTVAAAALAVIAAAFLISGIGIIDCGTDKECFLEAARDCRRAVFTESTRSDFGNFTLVTITRTEITGFRGGGRECNYKVTVRDVRIDGDRASVPENISKELEKLMGSEMDCVRGCSDMTKNKIPGTGARGNCSGGFASIMAGMADMMGADAGAVAAPESPAYEDVVKELREGEIIGYVFPEKLNLTPGAPGTFEIGIRNVDYIGRCFLISMIVNVTSPESIYQSYGCQDTLSCAPLRDFVSSWFSYGRVVWIDGQAIEFYSGYVRPALNASAGVYTFEVSSAYSQATSPQECDTSNDFSTKYHANQFQIMVM
jgi:hypothetical protein